MKLINTFATCWMLLFTVTFVACQSESNTKQEQEKPTKQEEVPKEIISKVLTVDDFEKGITNASDIQLIDVRTPAEVADGSIAGAVNYDFYGDDFMQKIEKLDREKPTYIYCRSGGRSGKTAVMMKEMGFREVYDLEGGYNAWKTSDKN